MRSRRHYQVTLWVLVPISVLSLVLMLSALRGEGTANDNKIVGTFIGGTGRYAGATGIYEFSWRFVMQGEDGTIQGQSIGLQGRVRFDRSEPISGTSGT